MRVDDSGQAEEHEDDGLADVGQHLHEVLDGRVGLLGDVGLYILLHAQAAERDSETHGWQLVQV